VQIPPAVRTVTRRVWAWLRELPPFVIVAAGFAIGMFYAYPGLVSLDSLDQLVEARSGVYTDGHPPFMQAMWHFVEYFMTGTFGMLVIHTVAFLAGTYLLLKRALPPRGAALATVLIYLFPPVLCPLAAIWKDCIMAGFFLLGTAAFLDERRWVRCAGIACLFIATTVRYNAPAASMSLIVLLFDVGKQRVVRYVLSTGVWIALTLASIGTNLALTDIHMHFWQSSLAVYDIAGTISYVDGTIPDDELRKTFEGTNLLVDHDIHAAIRHQYTFDDFTPLIAGNGHLWDMPIEGTVPAPDAQLDAMSRAFWDVVTSHPGAYLRHRLAVTLGVLGVTSNDGMLVLTYHSSYREYMENVKLDTHPTRMQLRWQGRAQMLARYTPLFKPFLYLIFALVLLWLNRDRDVLALLLSGLGLESSLILLAPTPDYRYSHWMVICTLISAVLVFARRRKRKPTP